MVCAYKRELPGDCSVILRPVTLATLWSYSLCSLLTLFFPKLLLTNWEKENWGEGYGRKQQNLWPSAMIAAMMIILHENF